MHEAELEAVCVDAPTDPGGRWHAKDHLAHISWWRWQSAAALDAARTGSPLSPLAEDDTTQNAIIYEKTKDQAAAEVKRDAAESWAALRTALETASEEDLARPHPRHPEAEAWEAIPGMCGHIAIHLMFWFMDSGNVARAEAAARWGYDVECSVFPEGPKRAEAKYNLACFFARAGRIDEALPLLRDSLRDNSEVAGWARNDPDLDGVRDDPRIRELLAG